MRPHLRMRIDATAPAPYNGAMTDTTPHGGPRFGQAPRFGAHMSIAGAEVGMVPKGYLYFAITFALFVEFLNMRLRKDRRKAPVQLHGYTEDAAKEGILDKPKAEGGG